MTRRGHLFATFVALALLPSVSLAQTREEPPTEGAERPPERSGWVSGRVTDETGTGVEDASVEAVETGAFARTDAEGRYRLELPPGKYVVRVLSPGFYPIRAENVVVWAGARRTIDVRLELEAPDLEEHVVEAAPDAASVDALAVERKRSAAVGDAVGRSEMAKTPDRNAAQAARRVVGVTVVNNRFVYVRGLGERYTNALLNGVPLPSPEPDRAAVPLDLFPTLVLENITVVKTFTPDMPGDFAGGSVHIETRRIPDKPLFQLSLSGGLNSQATFRERLSHRGGKTDWLAFDDGTRGFPSELPDDELATANDTPEQNAARGNAVNSFMSATKAWTPPNFGANVIWGDAWKLGRESKLGSVVTVSYGRSFQHRTLERRVFDPDPTAASGLTALIDGEQVQSDDLVSWGAYGSVAYEVDPSHRLTLIGLHSQAADKTTTSFQGFYQANGSEVNSTRLSYTVRTLDYLQIGGEHRFDELDRAELDWFGSLARATRTEPDTRNTVFQLNQNDPDNPFWAYYDSSESGQHFWADQYENSLGAGLNWTQPIASSDTKLKAGGLFNLRSRNFEARRLALRRQRPAADAQVFACGGAQFKQSCIDDLFTPDNIGPNLLLEEGTAPEDAYDAELDVYAGYLMADVALTSDLRVILGDRLELTRQSIEPYSQFDPNANPPGASLDSADHLPAVSLVYSPTEKAKARFSLTRTLARPQLRELAPFAYSDYFAGRRISGNPELELTRIVNFDTRFEYFPTLSEVLAFSVFYKSFDDPIEPVVVPSGDKGLVTFQNAAGAKLIGVELEARKGLGFLAPQLRDFSLISNLTLAHSRIQVRQTEAGQLTNPSRAMVHQAPYVVNLGLDYTREAIGTSVRLSYNLVGPRIVEVGTEGLDDAYEQPRHTVDLTGSKKFGEHVELKLAAQNVFNSEIVRTQGPDDDGDNVILRYTDGAVYTLTGTYTH